MPAHGGLITMLEVDNLQCSRGSHCLFSGKRFNLPPGTLTRVMGGSGKFTLRRMMLSGLGPGNKAEVRWRGSSIRKQADEFCREMCHRLNVVIPPAADGPRSWPRGLSGSPTTARPGPCLRVAAGLS